MKVLITGASGFIGKNLKEKLQTQYDVIAPSHQELDLLDTNCVEQFLKIHSFDVIIHTANTNTTRKKNTTAYESLDGNLRMFFNLEHCKQFYEKMYYLGSGAEYGMEHYIPNMKKTYFDTHVPKDSYGFSKYVMSKCCANSDHIYDLRLFGVYGKYEEWERRFISNAICRALVGKDITIQKNVYFDYLWIDDFCQIMKWFIENQPQYHHYNVCRGTKIDLYSLAVMIREILNINCNIIVSEPGWKPEYTGNNSRLLSEIGDYPFTGFRESIEQLCAYYKQNINIIDENLLI